jgi:phosphoglycerate dehydrogenase-like enzyme
MSWRIRMYNILSVIEADDIRREELRLIAGDNNIIFTKKPTEEQILDSDIILGNVSPRIIARSDKLKWLQTQSAGVEAYLGGILKSGCLLTNGTGAYGVPISEHMLGLYLEVIKKLELYRDNQAYSAWKDMGRVKSVSGSKILIAGLGDIGGRFAAICKSMGAYTIGLRRKNIKKPDYIDELYLSEDLDSILPTVDCVAISLPGTQQTRGMFSRDRIFSMKNGAVLLNVGRGYIVDTEALCDALESGKLSGVGLDVTDPEPLPKGHRLWKIPTAVITPHIAGMGHSDLIDDAVYKICSDNLKRFLRGEPLKNIIDFETGYRKLQ